MKTRSFPEIFSYVTLYVFFVSLFGAFLTPVAFFIMYYFGLVISPLGVIALIVWKFYNKHDKNSYFLPALIVSVVFFIISFYMNLHAFDNLGGI